MRYGMLTAMALCAFNGACAPAVAPPAYRLALPAKHLMQDPKALPDIHEGDDLYVKLAEHRAGSAKDKRQISGLIRYIRLIHRRPKGAP